MISIDAPSLHHTVADKLIQLGDVGSYISEYLGHATDGSETFGRYGKRYKPSVLLEEVVKRIEQNLELR